MRNIRATGNGCADTSEVTRAEPLEWVINNNVTNLKKVKTENSHHTLKNLGFLNSFLIPLHHFLNNMWILNISTAQGHRFSLFWSKTEGLPFKGSHNTGVLRYKIWKLEQKNRKCVRIDKMPDLNVTRGLEALTRMLFLWLLRPTGYPLCHGAVRVRP